MHRRSAAHHRTGSARHGLTLVELLVVIGVIGIIVAITMPAVMGARAATRRTHCQSNLRQIGLALQMYVDRQGDRGIFPYAAVMPSITPQLPSLVEVLAPFIESSHDVFACPDDRPEFYKHEGLSYEYPARTLQGKRRPELLVDRQGNVVRSSSDVWIGYDFEPFHGKRGMPGSRNYVYLDGHVKAF